jgi:hypothetical protein
MKRVMAFVPGVFCELAAWPWRLLTSRGSEIAAVVLLLAAGALARAGDVPLRIKCDATCVAQPGVLEMRQGDRVVLTSEKKWSCSIFTREKSAAQTGASMCAVWGKELAGVTPPVLIFESENKEQVVVQLHLAAEDSARSGMSASMPKIFALGSLVFAVATLALGVFILLGSQKPEKAMAGWESDLQSKVGQMKVTTQQISAMLNFEPIAGGTSRTSQSRQPQSMPVPQQAIPQQNIALQQNIAPPVTPQQAFSPQSMFPQAVPPQAVPPQAAPQQPSQTVREPTVYDRFMAALTEWCRYPAMIPPEIARTRQSLETLGGQPGASELVQTIVEVAIRTTDCDLDPDHRDEYQQRALNQLIGSAGLTAIAPRQYDQFDPRRHTMVSKQTAPSTQHRHKVAEMVRRGFERNGKVIKKAEVRVFD